MEDYIKKVKTVRVELDRVLLMVEELEKSRETSLVKTKVEEAVMWAGKELQRKGNPNPYPHSKNPENAIVEPTADKYKG